MNSRQMLWSAPHPVPLRPFRAMRLFRTMRRAASFPIVAPLFKSAIRSDKGILTNPEKWQRQERY